MCFSSTMPRVIFPSVVRNVPTNLEYSIGFGIGGIGDLIAVELDPHVPSADIELTDGRMGRVYSGDLIVGVLGFREAPKAYVGVVPPEGIPIEPGDSSNLALLSSSGLIGDLISQNPYAPVPPLVHAVGLLQKQGTNLNLRTFSLEWEHNAPNMPPLIVFVGASSESGKTTAAATVIRGLVLQGIKVAAAKLTGAGRMRDMLTFRDAGAIRAYDFVDAGLPSTPDRASALPAAKGILKRIASEATPDVVVVELAGSLLVKANDAILKDKEIQDSIAGIVLAANDEVGVVGGIHLLSRKWGLTPVVVTGPVSDNQAGKTYVQNEVQLPAANWRDREQLLNLIKQALSSFKKDTT